MRVLLILLLSITSALAFDPAPLAASHGMVVSAQRLATAVGVDVLKAGGNAVDAAVAVGYALAVTYPAAGNLGGGGFMTVGSWISARRRRGRRRRGCFLMRTAASRRGDRRIVGLRSACLGRRRGWRRPG